MSIQYPTTARTAAGIAERLEQAVRDAELGAGEPLPSVRALAQELTVAPGTVAAAYRMLRDRGVLESRGRSGTYVRSRPPQAPRAVEVERQDGVIDLASGQPDPALLPRLRAGRATRAAAPVVPVLPELRELASHRLAADGVPTDDLTLASGGLDAIHRLLASRLRPGDVVAVEDPGWPNVLDLVAAMGLRSHPVAMDHRGPVPTSLQTALQAGARAVIVTSRAHNPTGAFVTPARARELRRVLSARPDTLVIEDDHAAELAGVPLAPLCGATGAWAFVRSTSKPYGPDLRLAVVAGDPATIDRVGARVRVASGWVSTVLQRLVVELWTDDATTATVARAAAAYDTRRTRLLADLAARGVAATGATGLNVWVPVLDETTAVTRLLRDGWAVAPGARFRQRTPPGVRITVSGLSTSALPRLAASVARAVAVTPSTSYTA